MERPYVPVLRAKQGEFDSVPQFHEAERNAIRPLLELAPRTVQTRNGKRQRKPLDKHLTDQARAAANATSEAQEVWDDDRCRLPGTVLAVTAAKGTLR